jgi:acyl-CoA synthetase (AMP-forming)/AMP-acid ligase II
LEASAPVHTVVDLLAASARRFPHQVALEYGTRSIDYAELDRQRLHFSRALRERGVRPGDNVLLVSENSIEYVIALFGVLSAAATLVPLPADTQPEKLAFIAGFVDARLILVGQAATATPVDRRCPCLTPSQRPPPTLRPAR